MGGLGLGIPVFKPGVPVSLSQKHKCQHRFYIFTAFGLGTRLDTGSINGTLEEREGGWIVDNMITDHPDLPQGFHFTGDKKI